MLLHIRQAEDLVESGDHRKLLGLDGIDPRPVEERDHELLDVAPVRLQPLLRVDLLGPQVLADLLGPSGERPVERIGQGVGRVGAGDQRLLPGGCRTDGRRRGNGGLADTALAGEQEDAHPGTAYPDEAAAVFAMRPRSAATFDP